MAGCSHHLHPWMCMKEAFFCRCSFSGLKQRGNGGAVYLQLLPKELKELPIDGLKTYDVSWNETFYMHKTLLLAINDFSTYAFLSGWSTERFLGTSVLHG